MTPALTATRLLASGVHPWGMLHGAAPLTVWLVVLGFVFLECAFLVGLFLPGDSLLATAGVVLSQHHHNGHAWSLATAATVVAVGGNQVGFFVGRRTGGRIVARKGGRVLNRHNLDRAGSFFRRRGFWAVVIARWIPWVRTLAPLIAGAARMSPRRYLAASSLGALVWVPTLLLLGYYGAGLLDAVPWLKHVAAWASIGGVALGAGYGLFRYRQEVRKPVDVSAARLGDEATPVG